MEPLLCTVASSGSEPPPKVVLYGQAYIFMLDFRSVASPHIPRREQHRGNERAFTGWKSRKQIGQPQWTGCARVVPVFLDGWALCSFLAVRKIHTLTAFGTTDGLAPCCGTIYNRVRSCPCPLPDTDAERVRMSVRPVVETVVSTPTINSLNSTVAPLVKPAKPCLGALVPSQMQTNTAGRVECDKFN